MVTSLNNFCLLPHLCRDSRNRRFVDVRVRPHSIGKGRKPSVDVERVKALRDSGMGGSGNPTHRSGGNPIRPQTYTTDEPPSFASFPYGQKRPLKRVQEGSFGS